MDERRGRQEAENRGLKPIGTLGVLVAAQPQTNRFKCDR